MRKILVLIILTLCSNLIGFGWPIPSSTRPKYQSSPYGPRLSTSGSKKFHTGIDLFSGGDSGLVSLPIIAQKKSKYFSSAWSGSGGNLLSIQDFDDSSIRYIYMHLAENYAEP